MASFLQRNVNSLSTTLDIVVAPFHVFMDLTPSLSINTQNEELKENKNLETKSDQSVEK